MRQFFVLGCNDPKGSIRRIIKFDDAADPERANLNSVLTGRERESTMKVFGYCFVASAFLVLTSGIAAADGLPKFGKTCVGKSGWNTNVCVSSNGTTLSSSYNWKGSVPTTGKHTGCKISSDVISCSGGTYTTASGSGRMDPVRVKLAGGKPVSMNW